MEGAGSGRSVMRIGVSALRQKLLNTTKVAFPTSMEQSLSFSLAGFLSLHPLFQFRLSSVSLRCSGIHRFRAHGHVAEDLGDDVVGGDAVAEDRQALESGRVHDGVGGLRRHVLEIRCFLDVGRSRVPLETVSGRNLHFRPLFVTLVNVGVALHKHVAAERLLDGVGDFLLGWPEIAQIDRIAVLVIGDGVAKEINLDAARESVGNHQRGRHKVVGLDLLVNTAFKVSVAAEHGRHHETVGVNGRRHILGQRTAVADAHGIVLIFDEIQCGAGRTGKLFACEHVDVVPDIICMAKSIGAGMPISAITGKAEIIDAPHLGGVGGTYGGNPLACVAAIEAIKILSSDAFLARVNHVGNLIISTLNNWKNKYACIGDVRGLGAMLLVEFVKDRNTKEPDVEIAMEIIKDAVSHGIILIRAGLYSNCIRLLPPIVMTDEQLAEGLQVLENAIQRAQEKRAK